MTKADLVEKVSQQINLTKKQTEVVVNTVFQSITESLENGKGVEIRGFGSFSLHYRVPRIGRNPKTGTPVALSGKYVPHFKPGKELRDRVNTSMLVESHS